MSCIYIDDNKKNETIQSKNRKKGGADAAQKDQAAVLRRYFKHYPYKKVMMNPSPFFDANGKPLHRPKRKMRQNAVMIYIFYNYVSSNLLNVPLLFLLL